MEKEKKIKVAFISPSSYAYFYDEKGAIYGGAELQMFLLAKQLAQKPVFEILFFIADKGQERISYFENIKLIRCINLKKEENSLSRIFKAIRMFMLLIRFSPDVVFTSTANSIAGLVAFYKILSGKKHIHRTAALAEVDQSWINNNGLTGKIFRFGLKKADQILTQSEDHRQMILNNYKKSSEILRNAYLTEEQIFRKEQFVLWVGRYDVLKQPELCIKAAGLLPEISFIMICPYEEHESKEWNQLFEQCKKLQNIHFIQSVPFSEVQDYFNRAALFLNTSSSEGFPNTFLQATAAKTPMISLNVNPDNFLNEFNCGFFCGNDFNFMVQQIDYLMNHEDERKQKGENAFRYLKEMHDIEKIGIQLIEIINELVK